MKRKKKDTEKPSIVRQPGMIHLYSEYSSTDERKFPKKKRRQANKGFNIEDKNVANMKRCKLNKSAESNNSEEFSNKDQKTKKGKQKDTPINNSSHNKRSMLLRPPVTYNEEGKRVFYKGERATMCHQCQRNDKGRVVHCAICKKKRFCLSCMKSWYPLLSEEEIAEKCPVCRGNCNCKSCLRIGNKMIPEINVSRDDEVKYALHILKYLYPWFKTFHADQLAETEFEAKIKGVDASELVIPKAKLQLDEHIYCNKCNSSILDLHRSCNSCSYNLCLNCCREFKPSTNETPPAGIPCPQKKHKALELKSALDQISIPQLFEKIAQITSQKNPNFENNEGPSEESNFENNEDLTANLGGLNCLYCPVEKEGQLRHFQKRWAKGEPVIVRDVLALTAGSSLSWEPMVMWRALRDTKCKDLDDRLDVSALDCLFWSNVKISIRAFLSGYASGQSHDDSWPKLLKLIDFPPASSFNERLPRHTDDIRAALPLKQYSDPNGPLNLFAKNNNNKNKKRNDNNDNNNKKKRNDNNNVLKPKMCIAYGVREELLDGDSVTKIHCHMSDAVSIMTHTSELALTCEQIRAVEKRRQKNNKKDESKNGDNLKSKEYYGGALWDIWRREDVPKLKEYLIKHASEFVRYDNKPVLMVDDPIRDDCFYLSMEHKKKLKEEYGIEAWTFEQNIGEAVFIPAGCPHQVRNLKSCIKVAIEFISPESLRECISLSEEFRVKKDHDKSELEKMAIYALKKAVDDIDGVNSFGAGANEGLKRANYKKEMKRKRRGRLRRPRKAEHINGEMNSHESDPNSERKENNQRKENHQGNMTTQQESWTEQQRAFLIDLLRALNSPNYRDSNGWKQTCWSEISKHFNEEFPLANFSIEQLIEEEQALEKAYKAIKGLKDECGFEWDCDTKKVTAPKSDDVMKDLFEMNPLAKEWHGKTFLYYDDLGPLYEGFIIEDFEGQETNEDVEVMDESIPSSHEDSSTQNNSSFQAPHFSQNVENKPFDSDSIPSTHEPCFTQNNSPNSSQDEEVSPQNLQEPCFTQNCSSVLAPSFPQVETSPQNGENEPPHGDFIPSTPKPNSTQNNSSVQSPDFSQTKTSQNVENEPPRRDFIPSTPKPNSTQNNSFVQSPDFSQTKTSQNVENESPHGDFIASEPNFTQNNLSVEISPKNDGNEPLHRNVVPSEPNLPNFTQSNSPIQTPHFPQALISPQNIENEPLHGNSTPSTQERSCTQNNSSVKPPDFQQVEIPPQSVENDPIPSNQEPSSTQNDASIKTREFPQVEISTRILIPQQEVSVHETSKWKGVESERSETNNYVNAMEKQDEVSRMRLELECKRFDLEMKYSFKNAMDIFYSLDGFSFEDYDKVSELFLRDEKIRNAFIDVKEEYKARWISLRIKGQ